MRIERIDEKTVKCFLSNEELEEYEIDYKDFVMRSDRAREIVQEIMEQAHEEVGFNPPKFAFDLQIMVVPDQGLVLVFSDKDPDMKDGEQLMECLKEMQRVLQKDKEAINKKMSEAEEALKNKKKAANVRPDYAIFVFSVLRDVMNYASLLPNNLRVLSALYEMNGMYYLYLQKNHASYERFSKACIMAMEFGRLYSAEPDRLIQLQEHGTCLIEEKAIRKLKG